LSATRVWRILTGGRSSDRAGRCVLTGARQRAGHRMQTAGSLGVVSRIVGLMSRAP